MKFFKNSLKNMLIISLIASGSMGASANTSPTYTTFPQGAEHPKYLLLEQQFSNGPGYCLFRVDSFENRLNPVQLHSFSNDTVHFVGGEDFWNQDLLPTFAHYAKLHEDNARREEVIVNKEFKNLTDQWRAEFKAYYKTVKELEGRIAKSLRLRKEWSNTSYDYLEKFGFKIIDNELTFSDHRSENGPDEVVLDWNKIEPPAEITVNGVNIKTKEDIPSIWKGVREVMFAYINFSEIQTHARELATLLEQVESLKKSFLTLGFSADEFKLNKVFLETWNEESGLQLKESQQKGETLEASLETLLKWNQFSDINLFTKQVRAWNRLGEMINKQSAFSHNALKEVLYDSLNHEETRGLLYSAVANAHDDKKWDASKPAPFPPCPKGLTWPLPLSQQGR